MSQLLKSTSAMGLATSLSRVLGLVREIVYAHFMGTTAVAGAFKFAFQLPNLFRRLLGEGALTAAFVPIFKEKERSEGEAAAWHSANAVMSGMVILTSAIVGLVLVVVSVLLLLARVHFTQAGAPVFPPWPIPIFSAETRLMLELLRLMFPYLLLVCLAAMCMGLLNARGHFFLPAMGATMLNVVMIGSVFLLAPRFGKTLDTQIFALAVGVLLAGVAQFAFQVPTLWREGFRFRWVKPWGNDTVALVVQRMIPGTIGVAAFQFNVVLINAVAFWVDGSIVAAFDTAVRLMEFPQGVVGISLATYLLTTLSGLAAEKNYDSFRAHLLEGLGYLIFMNLLAAVLLLVLAEPIVRLLFQRGSFTALSTQLVKSSVIGLAPGLVAFSTVNILARAFYALGDTKTPMRISVACLLINLVISLLLLHPFREFGLGLANSITAFVNLWLLGRVLRKKLSKLDYSALQPVIVSSLAAALAAGIVAAASYWLLDRRFGHALLWQRAVQVFVPMALASGLYLGLCFWLRVPQAGVMKEMLLRRWRRR